MSENLVIEGVDVDQEQDSVKLRQLLDQCKEEEERGRIEIRLKFLDEQAASEVKLESSSKETVLASRTDVTVESKSSKTAEVQVVAAASASSSTISSSSSSSSSSSTIISQKSFESTEFDSKTIQSQTQQQRVSSDSKSVFSSHQSSSSSTTKMATSSSSTSSGVTSVNKFKQLDQQAKM